MVYHRDGGRLASLAEGRSLVLGRGHSADLSIDDVSLSRRHARFVLIDDEVWVEDLGSTNGTRVNGRRLTDRTRVGVGDEVYLGSVAVCLHRLAPADPLFRGMENHDHFVTLLHEEIVRARTFGRKVAAVMVRDASRGKPHFARCCLRIQQSLRPVDRMTMYGRKAALLSLPETDGQQAMALARSLVDNAAENEPPLVCGTGVFPDDAASAEELIGFVRAAAQRATTGKPVQSAADLPESPSDRSPVVVADEMREVYRLARRVAPSPLPVLILGETGTGKEVITRVIHDAGPRRARALHCVNCAAIPSQLLESALFGHERGAFTGATGQRKGIFEEADGGTVLLDEIGELSAGAQAALLRVLETKRLSRVGSSKEIEVDTRVIAATNRDLEAMCQSGTFRSDLYYRLNTLILKIPPLRQRPEEILPLATRFLKEAARANRCRAREIDPTAQKMLRHYAWPGNVRELRNVIERAVIISEGARITADDLPEAIRRGERARGADSTEVTRAVTNDSTGLRDRVHQFEAQLIVAALEAHHWNQTEAAQALDIPVRTLAYKINKYGIEIKKSGR